MDTVIRERRTHIIQSNAVLISKPQIPHLYAHKELKYN